MTLRVKDNSLTLITATIEDNVDLDMFKDAFCFRINEEHLILIQIVSNLPFEMVPDVSRCYYLR